MQYTYLKGALVLGGLLCAGDEAREVRHEPRNHSAVVLCQVADYVYAYVHACVGKGRERREEGGGAGVRA